MAFAYAVFWEDERQDSVWVGLLLQCRLTNLLQQLVLSGCVLICRVGLLLQCFLQQLVGVFLGARTHGLETGKGGHTHHFNLGFPTRPSKAYVSQNGLCKAEALPGLHKMGQDGPKMGQERDRDNDKDLSALKGCRRIIR